MEISIAEESGESGGHIEMEPSPGPGFLERLIGELLDLEPELEL